VYEESLLPITVLSTVVLGGVVFDFLWLVPIVLGLALIGVLTLRFIAPLQKTKHR
jgi:hypothetical protein